MDSARSYHHGNLHEALLREGLAMLIGEDGEQLSLRALARRVGVSAPSVYRHFPDKEALLAALAREGLARMAALQRAAASGAQGPHSALAAIGYAYVRFAMANPALFRLIFASSAGVGEIGEAEAFKMLREHAAATLSADAGREAIDRSALRSWTMVHGLAMLILDGQIPADDAVLDALLAPVPGASA